MGFFIHQFRHNNYVLGAQENRFSQRLYLNFDKTCMVLEVPVNFRLKEIIQ